MKFARENYPIYCLGLYLVVWIILAINPVDRFTWFLENLLPFIFVPFLVINYKRNRLSNISYTVITIFMIFHAIGAYYTYSEVPFISSFLNTNFNRDHYDRVVHFSFGLLMVYPFREFLIRNTKTKITGFWSYLTPVTLIMAASSSYEIIEWATAVIVQQENAVAWLGLQGDVFDPQKDTLLASLGSIITMSITAIKIKYNRE